MFLFTQFRSIYFRPCSHFANRCCSEKIFAADKLHVHTALMLSVTKTEAIPLRSK